ncbi:MAG: 16S rRNA (guanine(527)-N(7))-methyltransferase RsmG [Meiothermus sp.]
MPLSAHARRLLEAALAQLGIPPVRSDQIEQLSRLYDLLIESNAKTNLTAITDEAGFVLKHAVDSLTCLLTGLFEGQERVIDVGTGAGFPGLPLRIAKPALRLGLLEATRKKVEYLERAIQALPLANVQALWGRAEELAHKPEFREAYDRAVVRAVGTMATVAELGLPFVRVGGFLVVQKGPDLRDELRPLPKALEILGGKLVEIKELRLPVIEDQRRLLVIEKTAETPLQYPRRPGLPAKHPLC